MKRLIELRFLNLVEVTDSCWHWKGVKVRGYGQFQEGVRKTVRAHRWAYEYWIGPIPEGMTIDHTCHDPATCARGQDCPHRGCVNPTHLAPVPNGENARRGQNAAKTHCKWGHELSADNLVFKRNRPTRRECKTCHQRRDVERRTRIRQQRTRR